MSPTFICTPREGSLHWWGSLLGPQEALCPRSGSAWCPLSLLGPVQGDSKEEEAYGAAGGRPGWEAYGVSSTPGWGAPAAACDCGPDMRQRSAPRRSARPARPVEPPWVGKHPGSLAHPAGRGWVWTRCRPHWTPHAPRGARAGAHWLAAGLEAARKYPEPGQRQSAPMARAVLQRALCDCPAGHGAVRELVATVEPGCLLPRAGSRD